MPEFIVNVREVHVQPYRVTAKTALEAILIVEDGGGTVLEDQMEYSHTLESDSWNVRKILKVDEDSTTKECPNCLRSIHTFIRRYKTVAVKNREKAR